MLDTDPTCYNLGISVTEMVRMLHSVHCIVIGYRVKQSLNCV